MDIHRCRFVPYPPSTINVLAFSHSSITRERGNAETLKTLRLAIGRANGDIEIWNPLSGAWLQESILRGGKDRSVDGLVWIQDPDEEDYAGNTITGKLRLFSIGYTTTVTEWDLETGQPLRQSSGNHGEIWCLAAQPALQKESKDAAGQWHGQNLITGCTDGAVVLYSTEDEDLKLQKVLVRPSAKKAKVISINFQDRNIVVAGCTDSTIRIYDIRTGSLVRGISLGGGPAGGPKEIIVWAVKCLPNGTIVSGDSTGEVRIWDAKTYTLVQRIKSHKQDVLSLATSADGSAILSGGMDRKTVIYKQIGSGRPRWAKVTHNRFHGHDVKTMATFEGKGISIVASGGPDSNPMIIPLREFGQEHQRMLPSHPQDSIIQSAPDRRLVMSWWEREVHIWRVLKPTKPKKDSMESDSESEEWSHNRKLVAKIAIKGEANISSASISTDGSLLAVSTVNDIKLFRLRARSSGEGDALRVSRLDVPQRVSVSGAKLIQFSPDGKWLCIARKDNRLVAARVTNTTENSPSSKVLGTLSKLERLDRKIEKRVSLGGLGTYDRTINRMTFSSDSRVLAVGDLAGYIDTWVLEGQEYLTQDNGEDADDASSVSGDSDDGEEEKTAVVLGQHWIRNPSATLLPKLPAAPVVLSFRPANAKASNGPIPHPTRNNPHPHSHELPQGEDRLMVVTANQQVLEFEVLRGGLSAWSRSNPMTKFPAAFRAVRDQAMGCVWDMVESRQRFWLYGSNWMWMFDLSRDFPVQHKSNGGDLLDVEQSNGVAKTPGQKRKRRASAVSNSDNPKKGTSGAGSKVPDLELTTGMSRKLQKVTHDKDTEVSDIVWNRPGTNLDDDDNDDDDEEDNNNENLLPSDAKTPATLALDRLRRAADAATEGEGENGAPPHWWHTFKYRPIMGIVPIGGDAGLEVALVERPEWELDLPPRYYGEQEWEKPGF